MYSYLKRILDFILSIIVLILLFPLFIIVSILIKLDSKGAIIFKQKRIGKLGKSFYIYKFRSMTLGAEKLGVYESKNDLRVTRIGKIIRRFSIDELPQFINILKGDMSLVGPRPTLTYHPWKYEEYSDYQRKRFNLRPGITGWAQVNGRKNIDWTKRIEYDVYYVNNVSLIFDLFIILKTIFKVLFMKDNFNDKIKENFDKKKDL